MSSKRGLPPFVNRLAAKIAGPVALAGPIFWYAAGGAPFWSAVGGGLLSGAVAYGAAYFWLDGRLRRTGAALRHLRRHHFHDLAPPSDPNDELGVLMREVHRTGQKLENEIRELKELESYRQEFIGNVSHELKTPIFSVQGFTETLLDGALKDDAVNRTFLEKILHNVNRLDTLAQDLSAITEIETGEMEMSTAPFQISEVFGDVLDSVQLKADQKNIAVQQQLDAPLPEVYGDRDRIQRVLVNLVDNAIKYNEAGGTVVLRAQSQSTSEVSVEVNDDGIGISSKHLPRLTERFYRVDKSRSRNQGGTGLGLAIVKHILGAHDRDLHVESTPGEGSTFHFTLPTAPRPTSSTA